MGFTFKENCSDIRNTKVYDLHKFLISKKSRVDIFDPWVDKVEVYNNYKIKLIKKIRKHNYDTIVFTVPHKQFTKLTKRTINSYLKKSNLVIDLKNIFPKIIIILNCNFSMKNKFFKFSVKISKKSKKIFINKKSYKSIFTT